MTRPEARSITYGISNWEVDIAANFDKIFATPFPILTVDDVADLPTASSYDDCLALAPYNGEQRLYISDGSSWSLYDSIASYVADSTATTVSQMVTDFNSLLAALKAASPVPLMASS